MVYPAKVPTEPLYNPNPADGTKYTRTQKKELSLGPREKPRAPKNQPREAPNLYRVVRMYRWA